MQLEYLKNPILLGIFGAVITYLYMYWRNEQEAKEDKKKKGNINIVTPGVMGVLVWFIASSYLDYNPSQSGSGTLEHFPNSFGKGTITNIGKLKDSFNNEPQIKLSEAENTLGSIGSKSYRLIGKNKVVLPQTDVFIDIAKF